MAGADARYPQSYRRGYEHGAWDVLSAVIHRLAPREREAFLGWYREVQVWRYANTRGAPMSPGFPPDTQPLRDKLPKLR